MQPNQILEKNERHAKCSFKQHRSWLKIFWAARYELEKKRWADAVVAYMSAIEAAELLLNYSDKNYVTAYHRTVMELIFVMRKKDHDVDLGPLVAISRRKIISYLKTVEAGKSESSLMRPIEDMAFSPEEEMEHWMNTMLAIEQSSVATIH